MDSLGEIGSEEDPNTHSGAIVSDGFSSPQSHRVTRRVSLRSWKSARSITSTTLEEDHDQYLDMTNSSRSSLRENPLEAITIFASNQGQERRMSEGSCIQVIPDCFPNEKELSALFIDNNDKSVTSFTAQTRNSKSTIRDSSSSLNNAPASLHLTQAALQHQKHNDNDNDVPAVQLLPDQFLPASNGDQQEDDVDSNSLTASIIEDLDLLNDLYGSGDEEDLLPSNGPPSRMHLCFSQPSTARRKSFDVQLHKSRNRRRSSFIFRNSTTFHANDYPTFPLDDKQTRSSQAHSNQRRTSFNSLASREQLWENLAQQQQQRTERHVSFKGAQVEKMRESQNQSTEELAHQNGSHTCIVSELPSSDKNLSASHATHPKSILKVSDSAVPESGAKSSTSKTVRFATNQSNRVWVVSHEYSIVPDDCKATVWWDGDELQEIYQQEYDDLEEDTEDAWGEALFTAFESVSPTTPNETNAVLPFPVFTACQSARGFENLVYAVEDHVLAHQQAVLETQHQMIEDIDGIDDNLFEEIIALRSFKYSHSCRMVALRLGQLDASLVQLYEEQHESHLSIALDEE